MDRSRLDRHPFARRALVRRAFEQRIFAALIVAVLLPTTGCGRLLATAIYAWNGGNFVEAEFDGLESKRVVIVCRPPTSLGFRYPHADRQLARRIGSLLALNVDDIEIVNYRDVDNWADEGDGEDFRDLAQAVEADMVVHIDLLDFELNKGPTLYQGRAEVEISVYDMANDDAPVWEKSLGEFVFPAVGGLPTADKSSKQFQKQYLEVLSDRIARNFYRHDPSFDFALDSTAHR
jgi:hypothetical protein